MKNNLISLTLVTLLTSCFLSTWDARLVLQNNTDKKIGYLEDLINKTETLDTVYCNEWKLQWINPHDEEIITRPEKWEFSLRNHPERIVVIVVINEDSLSKYGICKILRKQIFMKRFDYTYDDLQKLNWKVIFDGK